jgi:hypothetical protein
MVRIGLVTSHSSADAFYVDRTCALASLFPEGWYSGPVTSDTEAVKVNPIVAT